MNSTSIQKVINSFGLDIRRYPTRLLKNRSILLRDRGVDLILDVGANIGQYGSELRRIGYDKDIISFEPLSKTFESLQAAARSDSKWTLRNYALGDKVETIDINISGNSPSSSILDINERHTDAAPSTKYIGKEAIKVETLDNIFVDDWSNRTPFVKVDVQGFEQNVLKGATDSMKHIIGWQIELSLVPLYTDEANYLDIIETMNSYGYQLYSIETGFMNSKTGQLLQFDGVFFRD